ncbi:hypothetical protein KFE25_012802 [Diacronema lutheri]|uniref:Uncharacterized protein n=2 Tax=Diacronema lutheri TaxID=2081491 RepID=A0A8J5XES7_DIALT|nr:hypothetical protein KFE25_012802 [Diacronema lutheri]
MVADIFAVVALLSVPTCASAPSGALRLLRAPRLVRATRLPPARACAPRMAELEPDAAEPTPERDWDGALRNLTSGGASGAANGTRPASPEDEPVYRIASSRERLADSRKKYVDSMNEREEQLVSTWGSERGLLGALGVVGVILCFYIYVGLSGGLDTPRPDIPLDEPGASSEYEAGERLLQTLR